VSLAQTSVSGADGAVARVWMSGLDLRIQGVAAGQTTVNVTVDSNGKLASTSFVVTVTALQGDVNGDGAVNISDVTELINLLLTHQLDVPGADVNGDGEVNITDVTVLINYLLTGRME